MVDDEWSTPDVFNRGYRFIIAVGMLFMCYSHAWVDINSWMQIMYIMLRVGNPGCMDVM